MNSIAIAESTAEPYDIEFFWDPVCPFAWITSRWVEKVAAQRDYRIDWRFISLRLLNKHKDYASEFPPEYEAGHTAGLRMLRVAAAVRADRGRAPLGACAARPYVPLRIRVGTPTRSPCACSAGAGK